MSTTAVQYLSNATNLENVIMRWFIVFHLNYHANEAKMSRTKFFENHHHNKKILIFVVICCSVFYVFERYKIYFHMHFLFHTTNTAEIWNEFSQRSAKKFSSVLTQLLIQYLIDMWFFIETEIGNLIKFSM